LWSDLSDLKRRRKKNVQRLLARNSYLFYNNKSYITWLICKDWKFIEKLIKIYGYYKEARFKVVFAGTAGAYGKMVILEISKPDQLEIFKKRKRNYSLRYANNGEKNQGSGFLETGNIYIKYAHLKKIKVAENAEIDAGVVVGIAGTSGVPGGTCRPHVHFEIASSKSSSGLTNRVNPGFYVYYKNENEMTEAEKKNQENRKNIGKR